MVGEAKIVGACLAAHRRKGERTNVGARELLGLAAGSVGKVVQRSQSILMGRGQRRWTDRPSCQAPHHNNECSGFREEHEVIQFCLYSVVLKPISLENFV